MKDSIREARLNKGITQEELAQIMGVTQAAVSQWESGVTIPRTCDLVKLSQALGITVADLFDDSKAG